MSSDSVEHNEGADAKAQRLSSVLSEPTDVLSLPGRWDRGTWIRAGILAVLFLAAHKNLVWWVGLGWYRNINWSHGFLIPVFSLYLLYSRRWEIQNTARRPWLAGLAIMLIFLVAEVAFLGVLPALRNSSMAAFAMVGVLFGLVLYMTGWRLIGLLWLPILYLALAIPLPGQYYTKIAYPLQEFAAAGAVGILRAVGVEIVRDASKLTLISQSGFQHGLTVAEACSGMHLLMAFVALGIATAYLENRPLWQRIILVAAGLPIAVFCNVLRVTITCTMYYIDKEELGQNVLHNFTGMLMLIPAFAMLWGLGWVLSHLFVESDEGDDDEIEAEEAVA